MFMNINNPRSEKSERGLLSAFWRLAVVLSERALILRCQTDNLDAEPCELNWVSWR